MVKIKKVSNGYIVEDISSNEESVYETLDEVFEDLLLHFEGLNKYFKEDLYGRVKVIRGSKRPVLSHKEPTGNVTISPDSSTIPISSLKKERLSDFNEVSGHASS